MKREIKGITYDTEKACRMLSVTCGSCTSTLYRQNEWLGNHNYYFEVINELLVPVDIIDAIYYVYRWFELIQKDDVIKQSARVKIDENELLRLGIKKSEIRNAMMPCLPLFTSKNKKSA